MFGWEYPPFNSGGLGTACFGLTRALSSQDVAITFVLPKKVAISSNFMRFIFADVDNVSLEEFNSLYSGYITPQAYKDHLLRYSQGFDGDLFMEVKRYAVRAREIASKADFDIIHAHDWLTFPAAIAAKEVTNKPFVAHIHATEFDRTGNGSINSGVYEIERDGMEKADRVIAVSNFTKNTILRHYGIRNDKVSVIYNAIDSDEYLPDPNARFLKENFSKIVLYVGRLTLQKGPDYFIRAAKRVLDIDKDVFFVIAGSGDMQGQIMRQTASLGISDRVMFAGFLRDKELTQIYQAADIFVLPSVSEPFGLSTLEAQANGTPVLVSKQSGVSEIIKHALKVDFWDVEEMANKILSVLSYKSLHLALQQEGTRESRRLSWKNPARECIGIYNQLLHF